MPAVSENQRRAAGAALSAKRGKTDVSKLQGASKEMYDGMSEEDLRDFTKKSERDDAPNYEMAEDKDERCGTCYYYRAPKCTRFDFDASPDYTCDDQRGERKSAEVTAFLEGVMDKCATLDHATSHKVLMAGRNLPGDAGTLFQDLTDPFMKESKIKADIKVECRDHDDSLENLLRAVSHAKADTVNVDPDTKEYNKGFDISNLGDIRIDVEKAISINCKGDKKPLAEMLKHMKSIGNIGHSFGIDLEPNGGKSFGWDGDGSDSINKITVDGKKVASYIMGIDPAVPGSERTCRYTYDATTGRLVKVSTHSVPLQKKHEVEGADKADLHVDSEGAWKDDQDVKVLGAHNEPPFGSIRTEKPTHHTESTDPKEMSGYYEHFDNPKGWLRKQYGKASSVLMPKLAAKFNILTGGVEEDPDPEEKAQVPDMATTDATGKVGDGPEGGAAKMPQCEEPSDSSNETV